MLRNQKHTSMKLKMCPRRKLENWKKLENWRTLSTEVLFQYLLIEYTLDNPFDSFDPTLRHEKKCKETTLIRSLEKRFPRI